MRTQQEILDRIKSRKSEDFLAFEWPNYLKALTFKNAKQFFSCTMLTAFSEEAWEHQTEDEIMFKAIHYMPFAWEKANNFRGISAERSISHYIAWMWLLGYEDTERWEEYEYYGKPQLIEICELLGLDYRKWDDGVRSNTETYY